MNKFFEYAHTDYDGLVKLSKKEIEELIFNYIVSLKLKTEKTGSPSPNSYNPLMSPIQTFLEQNDIVLNWKKLKRYYPAKVPVSNQLAYTTEHIQEMLELVNCTRDTAFVHLLASTGIRIGAVFDLTCGDVNYVQDGAVITIYKDSTSEYRVCMTPEATTALKKYLKTRFNTEEYDPLFTVRDNSRKLTDGSIKDIMKRLRNRIGLNQGQGRKTTKSYSANHAFRKRVEIILSKVHLEPSFKTYLTNHDMTVSVYHYFKSIDDESLYNEFKKAIPELTISEESRLKEKHELEKQQLTQEIPDELKEKLESQDELMAKMMVQLASTKYMMYEKTYSECFGGKNPDLEKLAKRMSNEEIMDWNSIIKIVQREKDWTIKTDSNSDKMLRDSKERKEIQTLIKELKEEGRDTKTLEEMLKDFD